VFIQTLPPNNHAVLDFQISHKVQTPNKLKVHVHDTAIFQDTSRA